MSPTLVHRFHVVVGERPQASAMRWQAENWSYEDIGRGAQAIAAKLASHGIAPGDRVALLIRNSPQYVASYVGVLMSNAVAVPLNVLERAAVLARQIEHCGATVLLSDNAVPECKALADRLARTATLNIELPMAGSAGAAEWLVGVHTGESYEAGSEPVATDLAAIVYTSGTTGSPKGVMLSHGNLASNAESISGYLGLSEADRGLCVLPFHFSYGNSVWQSHLWAGAHLAIEDNLAYPHLTLKRIQDESISGFAGVPSTFALLLRQCSTESYDLSRLRYVTQAGGAMSRTAISDLRRKLPRTRIFIMYGQTEATARLSYLSPDRLDDKVGSVGLPIPGVQIEVRDADDASVPVGQTGEICARGPNVMLGYWGDPNATASALRSGWLHTGDLGHTDTEGYLYIDGRAGDTIKVGAFRVSPLEIEEVVMAMPGVRETIALGASDDLLGQSVCVVIVTDTGVQLDERSVRAFCRERLAAYKVPKVVRFAESLPRTSSGKVQRFKLAEEVGA